MKTLVVIGALLVGLSGQAFSMGHPHNVFAARKQMRAKTSASVSKHKTRPAAQSCWEYTSHFDKAEFGKRLLGALVKAY